MNTYTHMHALKKVRTRRASRCKGDSDCVGLKFATVNGTRVWAVVDTKEGPDSDMLVLPAAALRPFLDTVAHLEA